MNRIILENIIYLKCDTSVFVCSFYFSQYFCGWPRLLLYLMLPSPSQSSINLLSLSLKELILEFYASAVLFMRLFLLGYWDRSHPHHFTLCAILFLFSAHSSDISLRPSISETHFLYQIFSKCLNPPMTTLSGLHILLKKIQHLVCVRFYVH